MEVLLGVSDDTMAQFYQDPVGMIQAEFALHGSDDDKENLRCAPLPFSAAVLSRKSP